MTEAAPRSDPATLIVNEPRWLSLDRVYALMPAEQGIVGVRVRGQMMGTEEFDDPEDPMAYVRREWLQRYQGADLRDVDLLRGIDKANFRIAAEEVIGANLKTRRSLWTGKLPNSGTIRIRLRGGKRRRFIVLGRQDQQGVIAFFARAGVTVNA